LHSAWEHCGCHRGCRCSPASVGEDRVHRRRLSTQRMWIWQADMDACLCFTTRRPTANAAGLGHASRRVGRRASRRWQRSRDHPVGQRSSRCNRRQSDGSVDSSACLPRWLPPRQSAFRAARRVLELTPDRAGARTARRELDASAWPGCWPPTRCSACGASGGQARRVVRPAVGTCRWWSGMSGMSRYVRRCDPWGTQ